MENPTINGKGLITAKVIAKSIPLNNTSNSKPIITLEIEYHRFIHGEFMTHREFSRNSASSRAIPVLTNLQHVKDHSAVPIFWGKKQRGMQAYEANTKPVVFRDIEYSAEQVWENAIDYMIEVATALDASEYHKQVTNRLTEFGQIIKVVVTSTNFDNFFNLRLHHTAQPEIQELARVMFEAVHSAHTTQLAEDSWHTPYYADGAWIPSGSNDDGVAIDVHGVTRDTALKISASCCAQVSYRKLDQTLEKADIIFQNLVFSDPIHASALEHCATPIVSNEFFNVKFNPETWEKGITHVRRDGTLCSGNFAGYIQYRQLFDNHTCYEYQPA